MAKSACPPTSSFGSNQDQKPDNNLDWPNEQRARQRRQTQLYQGARTERLVECINHLCLYLI